jgi:hypothetical protein
MLPAMENNHLMRENRNSTVEKHERQLTLPSGKPTLIGQITTCVSASMQ